MAMDVPGSALALWMAAAHPHRAPAPMEGFLQLRAVCDDPALERGVIDMHATFKPEFLDRARAQWIGHILATPMRITACGTWAPLKLIAICPLPSPSPWSMEKDHTSDGLQGELRQSRLGSSLD